MTFAYPTITHRDAEPARAFSKDCGAPAIRIQAGCATVIIERSGMTQGRADKVAAMLNDIFAGVADARPLAIAAE